MRFKAVLFDCVGTLFWVKANPRLQLRLLYEALREAGYVSPYRDFFKAYEKAYSKYFKVRMEELREVSNNVWTAEALRLLGYQADPLDRGIIRAVEAYFEPYIGTVEPVGCLPSLLEGLKGSFRIGVVTNFTYAPAMRRILSRIKVLSLLDVVVISQEVGWRKPHPKIFDAALKGLNVQAEEALFVGDDPYDDVTGAGRVGMKTVLVAKPGNVNKVSPNVEAKPDFSLDSICSLKDLLGRG